MNRLDLQLDYSNMKQIFTEAILIVCFGICIGLTYNYPMIMDVFSGNVVATAIPEAVEGEVVPVPVALQDLQAIMPRAVIVDARISEFYGDGHLPGAVSLPFDTVDEVLGKFMRTYPVSRSVIVYCSGYGCNDSFDLAVRLMQEGYNDVMVYEGGFPEWRDAGLKVERGTP